MKLLRLRALAAALSLLTTLPSQADTKAPSTRASSPSAPPTVEIRVVGEERALGLVRATAAELFARLEVQLRVLPDNDPSASADAEPPLVLAYVDLRVPTAPLVDVDDGRTRQELMRRSISDVSSLETGVEAALHVVLATVESTLQLAKEKATPTPLAPAPRRVTRPSPRGIGLDVGALARLVSLGDTRLTPGAGAALDLRADVGPLQAELGLWGAIHATSQLDFDGADARFRPSALRLVPGVSVPISRKMSASAGIGVGLDHFVLDAQTPPSGGRARDHAVSDAVVASQLGLRFPLAGAWFVSVLGTLDLDLAPTRFVVERDGAHEALLALPRWRGGLLLAASLSPTSIRRFASRGKEP